MKKAKQMKRRKTFPSNFFYLIDELAPNPPLRPYSYDVMGDLTKAVFEQIRCKPLDWAARRTILLPQK